MRAGAQPAGDRRSGSFPPWPSRRSRRPSRPDRSRGWPSPALAIGAIRPTRRPRPMLTGRRRTTTGPSRWTRPGPEARRSRRRPGPPTPAPEPAMPSPDVDAVLPGPASREPARRPCRDGSVPDDTDDVPRRSTRPRPYRSVVEEGDQTAGRRHRSPATPATPAPTHGGLSRRIPGTHLAEAVGTGWTHHPPRALPAILRPNERHSTTICPDSPGAVQARTRSSSPDRPP